MSRIRRLFRTLFAVGLLLSTTACMSTPTVTPVPTFTATLVPPTVTPVPPRPSPTPETTEARNLAVTILNFENVVSDTLWINFTNRQNNYVGFRDGETMTCNGVVLQALDPQTFLYIASYRHGSASNGQYNCSYQWHGQITTLNFQVNRPVITSPANRSTVTRTNNFSVTYLSDGGTSISASAYDGSTSVSGQPSDQADSGTYTGIDLTKLSAATGTLDVRRDSPTITINGTGFRLVQLTYFTLTSETIFWR